MQDFKLLLIAYKYQYPFIGSSKEAMYLVVAVETTYNQLLLDYYCEHAGFARY